MATSGAGVSSECIAKFNELKLGRSTKWIIYKLSDDFKEVVIEESSAAADYEAFREKLIGAKTKGAVAPRYAVYDFEYELAAGEGKRSKITFLAWNPDNAGIKMKMVYSSSKDALRKALNGVAVDIQANDEEEIEYDTILERVRKGR